jgi:hypothetical protein
VVQVLVTVLVGRLSGRDGGGADEGEDCLLHYSDDRYSEVRREQVLK